MDIERIARAWKDPEYCAQESAEANETRVACAVGPAAPRSDAREPPLASSGEAPSDGDPLEPS